MTLHLPPRDRQAHGRGFGESVGRRPLSKVVAGACKIDESARTWARASASDRSADSSFDKSFEDEAIFGGLDCSNGSRALSTKGWGVLESKWSPDDKWTE